MVVTRETMVLLMDISSTMRPHVDVIFTSLAGFAQRKLLGHKHDALGVVFFGSEETDNVLNKKLGGYANVQVAREIQVVDNDLAGLFAQPPPGSRIGDALDAVVVGMDMFMQQLETTRKGQKRLLLITNAQSPLREPDKGTLQEQVEVMSDRLVEHDMKLDFLHISLQEKTFKSEKPLQCEQLLQVLVSRSQGQMEVLTNHISLMASIKPRVSGTTLYRGDLELHPALKVKVWVYKKVSQERIPTLKKFSDKAPASDPYATREVKMDVEYKSTLDPNILIPPEQRTKAYRYGTNNIPLDKKIVDTVKLDIQKGLKLVGFTSASNIPRHCYMKDTKIFIPEPGSTRSASAISALVRAMQKTEMVALVRCVWRQGQANVVLGVLTPDPAVDDRTDDGFYFNEVPFAEDIRWFPFSSFTNRPASQQPSLSQEAAADNLVKMLDLSSSAVEESLQPEKTCNPILARFYTFLHSRLLDPQAPVPPVFQPLQRIIEPDPNMLTKAQQASLQQFCDQFTLTANVQKGEHKFWREGIIDTNKVAEVDAMAVDGDIHSEISFESLAGKKVDEVGGLTPVQDFEALLARRDGDQFVSKAFRGIKKVIDDLLESAYKGNTYEKALSCLAALRSGCVTEEEPSEFNTYLRNLATRCQGRRLSDFWDRVVSVGITLISSAETSASDVSPAAAKEFSGGKREEALQLKEEPEDEVDEMDALLDEAM